MKQDDEVRVTEGNAEEPDSGPVTSAPVAGFIAELQHESGIDGRVTVLPGTT
jgi:hypothetical protein